MTIASEITNYANGLSDAYDAVSDMQGLIPQDKNMNNLDTAIRTIPQSTGPTYTAGNGINIDANNEISIDTAVVAEVADLPTDFTGATSSTAGANGLVPAPAAGDQGKALKGDGTWGDFSEKFVIMKYGEANAWTKFLDAYNNNKIIYCRASSNANPATGAQTRLAFMAYVSAETNPTNVEFQYVRSVGTKTSSQPVDQVFVYKLENTNGGTWSVQTRDMAPKLASGTNASVSYSSGTYTISATDTTYSDMTGATSGTAGAAGLVPAPAAGDQDKVLSGAGTWVAQSGGGSTYTAGNHIDITNDVISAIDYVSADSPTAAVSPSSPVTTPMIADGAVTSAKIATGVVPQITMTNVDPGEGTPLADNNFIAVYGTTGSLLDMFYPVGSYYETSNTSFNPNTAWGGTWVEDSDGKVLVSKDAGTFATVGDTGGVEKTNHVFYRQALNSGNFQDAGQAWVNDIFNRANTWLQQSGSSSLTLDTTVKALGGTVRTNTGSGTEVGFFKYTATTLQPYVVVKRWHRTA